MTAEDERLQRIAHAATTITSLAFELGHDGWELPSLPVELIEHFAAFDPPTVLGLLDRVAAAEAALADERRYSTMTLDSCSVERQGMATDVLALMDAALRGAS